ncbi:WD40 repeat domain-containing protein [Ktedonobacter robiniae]|uniref:WD40 repeat domain-containing protein n=1 Tax=Ktedonobacter robiniae TaxID=2778365 RepID=UPI001915E0F7|nr:hypothetical protein [Ktedonobacter robiniae]
MSVDPPTFSASVDDKRKKEFFLRSRAVLSAKAVNADGSFIISASWDHTLKAWDAATGSERLTLSVHSDRVHGCGMSGDRLIVSADCTLKVWDVQTGQCLLAFPVDRVLSGCAFHPDGEHLVACGWRGVYFLRLVM